jgi:hypothetical protein
LISAIRSSILGASVIPEKTRLFGLVSIFTNRGKSSADNSLSFMLNSFTNR